MKRTGVGGWIRGIGILVAVLMAGYGILALVIVPLQLRSAFAPGAPLSEEKIREIEARRDYFRIVGEVEFEGQRIVYDEIIQIRVKADFVSNMGQVRGGFRVQQSRLLIVRLLDKGGVLIMEVPDAAGLWSDLEGRAPDSPGQWTPEYVNMYLRPPPTILPEFYWVDDLQNPTVIEGYISESYYQQPTARLKILKDIKLEFVAPTPEAEAIAIVQVQEQPYFEFALLRQRAGGPYNWLAVAVYALPKTELATVPSLSSFVAQRNGDAAFVLEREKAQPLFDIAHKKYRWGVNATRALGVAQPKRYPLPEFDEGVLYLRTLKRYADDTIPAICENEGTSCRLLSNERGYLIYNKSTIAPRGTVLNIGSTSIHVYSGSAVVLSDSDTVYLVEAIRL